MMVNVSSKVVEYVGILILKLKVSCLCKYVQIRKNEVWVGYTCGNLEILVNVGYGGGKRRVICV